MAKYVVPTGAVHSFGIDELFFSVTDSKGVIESSNEVFVRLSHYSHDELMASPHNIIRHPEMPGAAFKLLWDTVRKGEPFAAYVRNLAANGSEYDVFATVTPLPGNRYLSVRTRPVCEDIFATTNGLYREVHAFEAGLKESGASRREAAASGVQKAAEMLKGLGFASYEDFQNAVLPAEVAGREALSAGFPRRPNAQGVLRDALETIEGVYNELAVWVDEQKDLADLSTELHRVADEIEGRLSNATVKPETIEAISAHGPAMQPLIEPLQVWTSMQSIVASTLTRLVESLRELEKTSARTRFRVALARLHTTMLATFIAELIDNGDNSSESVEAIWMLTKALRQGLYEMEEQTAAFRRLASNTVWNIDQAISMLGIPSQVLSMWKTTAETMTLPEDVAALVPGISEGVVDYTGKILNDSASLAARCNALGEQHDSTRMKALVDRAEDMAARLAQG